MNAFVGFSLFGCGYCVQFFKLKMWLGKKKQPPDPSAVLNIRFNTRTVSGFWYSDIFVVCLKNLHWFRWHWKSRQRRIWSADDTETEGRGELAPILKDTEVQKENTFRLHQIRRQKWSGILNDTRGRRKAQSDDTEREGRDELDWIQTNKNKQTKLGKREGSIRRH